MRSVWSRRRLGLDHGGLARGVEAGQQDGALHLRRGDGQAVFDRHHLVGADDGERHAAALARLEARAHARQRLDDPLHRPAAQRGVAGHEAGEAMAGQDAGEQARRGAGIAEVEHVGGLARRRRRRSRARSMRRCRHARPRRAQRARRAAAVASTSSPSSRPVIFVSPSARAPNIRARWETDLSPGRGRGPAAGRQGGRSAWPERHERTGQSPRQKWQKARLRRGALLACRNLVLTG